MNKSIQLIISIYTALIQYIKCNKQTNIMGNVMINALTESNSLKKQICTNSFS